MIANCRWNNNRRSPRVLDHWRKLFPTLVFMVQSLFLMVHYFRGDRQLLFQQGSVIAVLTVIGDCYFGGDRQFLAKSFTSPHWQSVKTVVQTSLWIPFVFGTKPTRFGSQWMVDQTLHIILLGLLLLVQTECLCFVTCLFTHSIRLCGQGLTSKVSYYSLFIWVNVL